LGSEHGSNGITTRLSSTFGCNAINVYRYIVLTAKCIKERRLGHKAHAAFSCDHLLAKSAKK